MINNDFHISIPISGLIKREHYNYQIIGLGGNWPAISSPSSGSFVATNKVMTVDTTITFLPNTGLAPSQNTLTYNLLSCGYQDNQLFTRVSARATNTSDNSIVNSDDTLVLYSGSIPKIGVSFPNKTTLSNSNITNITGTITGLIPYSKYNYTFSCLDSNWPSILKPISGSFTATGIMDTVISQLMFCYPSGYCTSGTNNLLSYTLDTNAEKSFNQNKLHTDLNLNITSECGDNFTSKPFTIECNDCLPCVRYANIAFSGSPLITLPSGCCQGYKFISVNVSNAIPGERYTYSFSGVSTTGINTIEFNPATGEFYFGSGGIGKINTIITTNLDDYAQTILSFELTHTNTNFISKDMIGLVCIGDQCNS